MQLLIIHELTEKSKHVKFTTMAKQKTKLQKLALKITNKVTAWHHRLFTYLLNKSKKSVWFTFVLLFICLYEITEHFIIPAILVWWGFLK